MSCYVPACAVPTYRPTYASSSRSPVCYPVGGIGSLSSSCGGMSSGAGGSTTAASFGTVTGANVGCVNQMPPSEIVIQPPAVTVIIPGAVLSASSDPVRVGGYTACASGSSGRTSRSMMSSCRPYICRS